MSIAQIHEQVAKEEQAKTAARYTPAIGTTANVLRRSSSLATSLKVDE